MICDVQAEGTKLIGAGSVFKVCVAAHLEAVIGIFKYFDDGMFVAERPHCAWDVWHHILVVHHSDRVQVKALNKLREGIVTDSGLSKVVHRCRYAILD
jgi:hypothetical protein